MMFELSYNAGYNVDFDVEFKLDCDGFDICYDVWLGNLDLNGYLYHLVCVAMATLTPTPYWHRSDLYYCLSY